MTQFFIIWLALLLPTTASATAVMPPCRTVFAATVAGTAADAEKTQLLIQHGRHTLSYSLFQPGLDHFVSPHGLIAHEQQLRRRLVLGDPLASDSDTPAVLDAFLETHKDPFFCAITRHTAQHLSQRGFLVNELGRDTRIHIPSYSLDGKDKTKLRQAYKKFLNSGYSVQEVSLVDGAPQSAMEHITQKWRSGKAVSTREVRFLTRPIVYSHEMDVRKFMVLNPAQEMVGLYFFDPLYDQGKVTGYSLAFKRKLPATLTGLEEAVTVWAIQTFQAEGRQWLNLGMTPLYKIEDTEFPHSKSLHHALKAVLKYGDGLIYNFSGHSDFKHRYRGDEFPVYVATRHEWNIRSVLSMIKASGLRCPPKQFTSILCCLCRNLLSGK